MASNKEPEAWTSPAGFEEMLQHFNDFVLRGNPLLGFVLSTHLFLESYLHQILKPALVRPEAVLGSSPSFFRLVAMAEALGVVKPDMARVLRALNTLRNKYVHRFRFEASEEEVEALLAALREMDDPFYSSRAPGSEGELGKALTALAVWFQRLYGQLILTPPGA